MSARSAAVIAVAGAAAAMVGLGIAMLTGAAAPAIVAVVVGAATAMWASRSDELLELSTRTGFDRLATAARMILTAGALAVVVNRDTAAVYAIVAVIVLVAWSAFSAVLLVTTTRHPAVAVANLDAARPARLLLAPWPAARTVAWVAIVLDAVAAVGGLLLGATEQFMYAAIIAIAFSARHAVPAVRSLLQARASTPGLIAAIEAYGPQAVVHVSAGPGQARYILGQWLQALESIPLRTMVILREPNQVAGLGYTTLPIVLAPTGRELSQAVVPSVRLALYLANGTLNGDLLREPLLRHVFLNHGDSDKSTSANPFNRVYDELWVAGQAAVDRYAAAGINLPPERYAIVGRPQLRGVSTGRRNTGDGLTVLYAPTFEGYFEESNYSSLERMGGVIVRALLERLPDARILFKPHPATGRHRSAMTLARLEIEALLRAADGDGRRHVIVDERRRMTLYDAFDQADILITDVSSVATDFLWTERPVIVTNPRGLTGERFVQLFPTAATAYRLDPDGTAAPDLVAMAAADDPQREHRLAARSYVLGSSDDPISAFAGAATAAYQRAVDHADRVRNTFTFDTHEIAPTVVDPGRS